MKKLILLASAALLCALLFLIPKASRPAESPPYILHAGGVTPDGKIGSNSAEAMSHSYDQGFYWLEIDFSWTSDGHLACVHDWDAYYSINRTGVPVPDLKLFESLRKDTYGFQNHTLESLTAWMEAHPKAVIVTDVKEQNLKAAELLSRYESLRDRFVIQIYSAEEYDAVVSLGFDRVIFTFYRIKPGEPAQLQFAQLSGMEHLIAVTIPAQEEYAELTAMVRKQGFSYYVHTVNDPLEQQKWLDEGAWGVYCDFPPQSPASK